MRGGVSNISHMKKRMILSSPRAWGCFHRVNEKDVCSKVFPTCVGVFLKIFEERVDATSLPHVRGGVSVSSVSGTTLTLSSPRAWGCFQLAWLTKFSRKVFPTCVGVFLNSAENLYERASLPHVRGGVSTPLGFPP